MTETKKICGQCGKEKPASEYYIHHTGEYEGMLFRCCKECERAQKRAYYRRLHPDGLRYDMTRGRVMRKKDGVVTIGWSGSMLAELRRLFPVTKNEEIAGVLGVSVRTMIRKARELGLKKDDGWLSGVWDDNRKMAQMMSRALGYPGGYKPGRPDTGTEWRKGYVMPEESRRKQAASMRRYAMAHKSDYRKRGLKAWETRRRRAEENGTQA